MILKTSSRLLLVFACVAYVTQVPRIGAVVPGTRASTQTFPRSKLLKHDRMRLMEAVAQNKPFVTLLLAARPAMNNALVADLRKLDGVVQYRDDDVDYLRVEIPTNHVQQLAMSEALESVNLAGSIDYLSQADDDQVQTPIGAATEIPAGS